MAASTLQKRLAADGTSFQALKDALRRTGHRPPPHQTVPLVALADELGFADSAAFQRAFKSWTAAPGGLPPERCVMGASCRRSMSVKGRKAPSPEPLGDVDALLNAPP
jgi:AraC-like DNA-binding protein